MQPLLKLQSVHKTIGKQVILDQVDFQVMPGQIVGLIGANGAGKSTLLQAALGLTHYQGDIYVLGQPLTQQRHQMLQQVAYIADVAVMPDWMQVAQAIDYVQGVHPAFNADKARQFLASTNIKATAKIKALSKGMKTQLHLALILALDVKLLILDEPTLGLDLVTRQSFYRNLLSHFYQADKAIVITTHQIEEIEHVISDVAFIKQGQLTQQSSIEGFKSRYQLLAVGPEQLAGAKALSPLFTQQLLGQSHCLFEHQCRDTLSQLGQVQVPSLSDIFNYLMQPEVQA